MTKQDPRVFCCGKCRPGEDCLEQCRVIGEVPPGLKLDCCRGGEEGDNCLEKCGK
jgi:hypothetical protein